MATNAVPMRDLQKQGHKPRPCNGCAYLCSAEHGADADVIQELEPDLPTLLLALGVLAIEF
jgi:hypothetical protein